MLKKARFHFKSVINVMILNEKEWGEVKEYMSLQIKAASRQVIKPLIGLYGKSGGGKTYSALLLARGIVGNKGKIVLIDSENGRGNIYADLIPGGYDILDLTPPFSPDRYIQALEACSKADIVVIDSMTHEWSGEGGVLDMQEAELTRMASQDFAKRERCKMAAWIKPKMAHKKMVSQILRMPMAIICCLRGEEKTRQVKDEKTRKNVVVTDEFCSPLFDHRFIFEMLINGEVLNGGYFRVEKITHPGLRTCLPVKGEIIKLEHGKAIAKWCSSPSMPEVAPPHSDEPKASTDPDPANFKVEIWKLLKPVWSKALEPSKELETVTKWLREKAILAKGMSLSEAIEDEELAADIYTQIPIALGGAG